MRQLGFWGGRPAPRKSAIFALQDGKIPDSPPRKPALRGPRRRGVWGGSLLLPPPLFPGLLGPLEAAVGGLPGESRTPDPDPGLPPHPLAAYLSTPGRPLSPRLSLRGLCGDPRGSAATLCTPAPAPGPPYARSSTFAKMGNLRLRRRGCPGGPLPLDAEPLWDPSPK